MINHTTKHESYQQPQMSYLHNVKQEGRMKGQTKKLIIILFGKEDMNIYLAVNNISIV
jgi:hypothetical protein